MFLFRIIRERRMSDPNNIVSELHSFLQQSVSKRNGIHSNSSLSWSWVCVKLFNLLSNYPSGVTRAIALAELDNEYQKTGGKLTPSHSQQQKNMTVSGILDTKTVLFESVLEVCVASFHDISGTTTKIAHLVDSKDDERHLQMYLHRKFYDFAHVLNAHTVRMTCCRLVTSHRGPKVELHLLPTEHMAVMIDSGEAEEMYDSFTANFSSASYTQPTYINDIQAKVISVGESEVLYSSDGTSYQRLIVQLADGDGISVPLVLWDSYVGFSRLFAKGDILFIVRPYARPANVTQGERSCCLEFGPATLFYILPYEPEQEILPSQHPTQSVITVKKTNDGRLDFLSYPERLSVSDLVPNLINGVLLAQCLHIGRRERSVDEQKMSCDSFHIEVQDNTGSVNVAIQDHTLKQYDIIHPCQWLLMTGLSSQYHGNGLVLSCDLKQGQLINVSSLPGLLTSPDLYAAVSLEEVDVLEPLSQFMISAMLTKWVLPQNFLSSQQLLRPIHCLCSHRVEVREDNVYCQTCGQSGLTLADGDTARDVGSCWKWVYDLKAVFTESETGRAITAQFTTTAAEALLQKCAQEMTSSTCESVSGHLEQHVGTGLRVCLSKITETSVDGTNYQYQVNCATPQLV